MSQLIQMIAEIQAGKRGWFSEAKVAKLTGINRSTVKEICLAADLFRYRDGRNGWVYSRPLD